MELPFKLFSVLRCAPHFPGNAQSVWDAKVRQIVEDSSPVPEYHQLFAEIFAVLRETLKIPRGSMIHVRKLHIFG